MFKYLKSIPARAFRVIDAATLPAQTEKQAIAELKFCFLCLLMAGFVFCFGLFISAFIAL